MSNTKPYYVSGTNPKLGLYQPYNHHHFHSNSSTTPLVFKPVTLPSLRKERQVVSIEPSDLNTNNANTSAKPYPWSASNSPKLSVNQATSISIIQDGSDIHSQPLTASWRRESNPQSSHRKSSITHPQLLLTTSINAKDWLEEENQEMDFTQEPIFPTSIISHQKQKPSTINELSEAMQYGRVSILKNIKSESETVETKQSIPSIRISLDILKSGIPCHLIKISKQQLTNIKHQAYVVPLPLYLLRQSQKVLPIPLSF